MLQKLNFIKEPLKIWQKQTVKEVNFLLFAVSIILLLTSIGNTVAQPAFPGAEGGGAISVGGRGGSIIEVTNLNNSGAGSFRAACEASGARTVIFKVGGTIIVKDDPIVIRNPYITIAGQTAPGDGIMIRSDESMKESALILSDCHDVIIRYIRMRPGPFAVDQAGDGFTIYKTAYNVIIDHCSISWASDENTEVWSKATAAYNFTWSWNLVAEGYGSHSCGFNSGSNDDCENMHDISIHHCVFVHNGKRNPLMKVKTSDVINNIVFGWKYFATQIRGGLIVDIIGNKYVTQTGYPISSYVKRKEILWNAHYADGQYPAPATGPVGDPSIYFAGNIGPHNSDPNATDAWSKMIEVTGEIWDYTGDGLNTSFQRSTRRTVDHYPITVNSVTDLDDLLLPTIGSAHKITEDGLFVENRDPVDIRIINDYKNGTGDTPYAVEDLDYPTMQDGTPYTDSDHDGMSDVWESAQGLNPNDASDRNGTNLSTDGYTNLEVFLNGTDLSQEDGKLSVAISSSIDDVEERVADGGTMETNSVDLDLGTKIVGLRFGGLNIPKGAIISNAYIQFAADEEETGSLNLTIKGFDYDDLSVFDDNVNCLTSKNTTSSSVNWSPDEWTIGDVGSAQKTPDLKSIVQEIVNRDGWAGDHIGFIFTSDDGYTGNERATDSYDEGVVPKLIVEYETATEADIILSKKISNSINIDGMLDSAWDDATAYTFTHANTDNEVTSRAFWDDTYLYLSFSVDDNVLDASGSAIWANDAIEIFFDPNNNKSATWSTDAGHKQFLIDLNSNKNYDPVSFSSGVESAVHSNSTDYTIEVRVLWSTLGVSPTIGTTIGFDIANDDKDGSANAFQYTYTGRTTNFRNPSKFAVIELDEPVPVKQYNVTFNTDGTTGALLDGNTSQTVDVNSNCTAVTANDPTGYDFVNWTGTNGFVTTTDNPLTVTNITSDMTITANYAEESPENNIRSSKINNGINIDGTLESEWNGAATYTFTHANTDNEVTSRVLWDDTYLYLSFSVDDNVLDASGSAIWANDAIEIFFDPNNNKSATWNTDAGHKQFLIDLNSNKNYDPVSFSSGVESAVHSNSTDYTIEVRVSWSTLGVSPSIGTVIGFDIANDDKDGSANAFQYTYTERTTNFRNPSKFAAIELVEAIPVDGNIRSSKISNSININGTLESEWNGAATYTFTHANTDNEVISRALWDDTYLYLSFSVDDNVLDASGSAIWANDAIEIFFDPNNNKSATWNTDAGHKQFLIDLNSNKNYDPSSFSSGVESAVHSNSTDYTIEVRVSWSTLGVSPAIGTVIGFDIANDDKDGSANAFQYTYTERTTNFRNPSLFTGLVLEGSKSAHIATVINEQSIVNSSTKPVSLYPNPTTGMLTIDGDNIQEIEIFDVMGRKCNLIITSELNSSRSYNLRNLSAGIYFVKISKEMGEVVTKKIILKK